MGLSTRNGLINETIEVLLWSWEEESQAFSYIVGGQALRPRKKSGGFGSQIILATGAGLERKR